MQAAASTIDEPQVSTQIPSSAAHGAISVTRFIGMHLLGTIFPITAGLLLFGWRGLGVMLCVIASAMIAALIWRRVGMRGWRLQLDYVLAMAALTSLTLPAHLFSFVDVVGQSSDAPWPILITAGVALVMFIWLLGGPGAGRLHPVILTHLLLVVLFNDLLTPWHTLRREHLFWGDVLKAPLNNVSIGNEISPPESYRTAWVYRPIESSPFDAETTPPPSMRLESFTGGYEAPERAWISLESLVRDRLPPLEDLILAGQPGSIGTTSAIAVIIGGLFLLYRGLIDFRVPLLTVVCAWLGFLILPVPSIITENARQWTWMVLREPNVGWALGLTFANYELVASPLLFVAFFLAGTPSVRPMTRRARAVYGVLLGLIAAVAQLYVSVSIGPYLALLMVSLLNPALDKWFRPRTLV